jgi:hypothetical protein
VSTSSAQPPSPEDLLAAIDDYDEKHHHYDDVFREVQDRIAQHGEAGKLDLAALTLWKRSAQGAWVSSLLHTDEKSVREATRRAFEASDDLQALGALAVLPGFASQAAMATAVLAAHCPREYGVMDRHALKALTAYGRDVGRSRGQTLRYLDAVRVLRDDLAAVRSGITARDVDKGLYVYGRRLP